MTSDRDARVARLTQQRQEAAAATERATLDALADMVVRGTPVTFTAVQRAAGVSSWYVYNKATVRAAIKKAREMQASAPARRAPRRADDGLRSELSDARAEIAELRDERDRLKSRLRRDLGAAVEQHTQADLISRIQDLERVRDSLTSDLALANKELIQRREKVSLLAEELEGVRTALRRIVRERSSP